MVEAGYPRMAAHELLTEARGRRRPARVEQEQFCTWYPETPRPALEGAIG